MKTVRRWSVLDCRQQPEAQTYNLAIMENDAGEYGFIRVAYSKNLVTHNGEQKSNPIIITIFPFGKMPNEQIVKFAEEHVGYLEKNFCFCKLVKEE